jgi:hypothetical protein
MLPPLKRIDKMSNIERLKSSVKCKAYLEKDKFSEDGYWLIGKHQDSEGETFANAIGNYFEEQYLLLATQGQEVIIKEICDKYDGLGLVT